MVTSFVIRPPETVLLSSYKCASVASTKGSTLHPTALHQLVLSVKSSRERLRGSCVHVASPAGEEK